MSTILNACIFNLDAAASKSLAAPVQGLNFIRLVGEATNSDALARLLQTGTVNLVFFHLDPDPATVLEVIDQAAGKYPDLAMIAVSDRTDPESILLSIRAGCDQFVCEPIDPKDLASAVARVAAKRLASTTRSRCICVMGTSGGAGATTVASNLALEIGNLVDRDCALIDLDLQYGDLASNFDFEPRYTINDLAEAGVELDRAVIASTLTMLPCKVAVLSRPELIEQTEAVTPELVHRILELIGAAYENVVIDLPHYFDHRSGVALTRADVVLLVCQLMVPSIRHARRTVETLLRMGVTEDRIGLIVNRVDGKSSRLASADVEETVRRPVWATVPNDFQFVSRSIDMGRPAAALDRNNAVRAAIRQLAKRVVSGPAAKTVDDAPRGFLSRLLAK